MTDIKQNHLFTGIMSAMAGFVLAIGYVQPKINDLQAQVEQRPPVVVMDMVGIAIKSVPIGSGEEAVKAHYAKTQEMIDEFQRQGAVVLSNEGVLTAPTQNVITADDFENYRSITSSNVATEAQPTNG